MVKVFTVLLALVVALSFGGLTFAKSLGDASPIHSSFPLGADGDKDDKGEKGDDQKMTNEKGEDEEKDKDKK